MGSALNTFSRVLQMRSDTLTLLIKTKLGYGWALRMFIIVSLIAGLGLWFGLSQIMAKQTLVEGLDAAAAEVSTVEGAVQGALSDAVTGDLAAVPGTLLEGMQAQAAPLLGQLGGVLGGLDQGALAVPDSAEGSDAAAKARAAALAKLKPIAEGIGATESQLADILLKADLTPEEINGLLARFHLDPAAVGEKLAALEIAAEEIDSLFATVRTAAVNAEPVLGVRFSRAIRFGGNWLSTPLNFAASWLVITLASLLVARSLGGKASVREHLTASLLATAPAFLMVGLFIPAIASGAGIPMALAVHLFTRLLALIGVIWALILLVRTIATAHEFSNWRALGAMGLTAVMLVLVAPIALAAAGGFLLAF